ALRQIVCFGQPLAGFGVVAVVVAAWAAVGRGTVFAVALGLLAAGFFALSHFAFSCVAVASDVLLALFAIAHLALTCIAVTSGVLLALFTLAAGVLIPIALSFPTVAVAFVNAVFALPPVAVGAAPFHRRRRYWVHRVGARCVND